MLIKNRNVKICINDTDKNLGPISADKSDVIKECLRQLYDIIKYNKISWEQAKQFIEKMKNVLRKTVNKHMIKGSCSKFEANFLMSKIDSFSISHCYIIIFIWKILKKSSGRKTYCSWLQLDFNSCITFCRILPKKI